MIIVEILLALCIGITSGILIYRFLNPRGIKIPYRLMERDNCFYCNEPINKKSFWAAFVVEPVTEEIVQAPICDDCSEHTYCYECKSRIHTSKITMIKDTPETILPLCSQCLQNWNYSEKEGWSRDDNS